MKLKEFEDIKKSLKIGDKIIINYRSNWRGGDGRPYNHRKGKDIIGEFNSIFHEGILLEGRDYPINYKAIRKVKIVTIKPQCQNPICNNSTNSEHSKFCKECSMNHHLKKGGYKRLGFHENGSIAGRPEIIDDLIKRLEAKGKLHKTKHLNS